MSEQALAMLIVTIALLGAVITFGIKRSVFLRWYQTWLSWDWYTRIAVLMIALGGAAMLTWGIRLS